MPRKYICTASLCCVPFRVYACDCGGSFDCQTGIMEIGIGNPRFDCTASILLHEATECVFAISNMRFSNPSHWRASDSYVFQFDHHQFSDAMDDVGMFVSIVYTPLYLAWKTRHKAR